MGLLCWCGANGQRVRTVRGVESTRGGTWPRWGGGSQEGFLEEGVLMLSRTE